MASWTPPAERIPVAVLGATGSVGQRFVERLADHPWFRPAELVASERSQGKPYGEAVRWLQSTPLPEALAGMRVLGPHEPLTSSLVFSALDAGVAGEVEIRHAEAGRLVVSNARNHRMHPQVPLLIPEVNPDHLDLIAHQPWSGGIITNPNCSTIGLALALKPLQDAFGVKAVRVVTLQAVSGAGIPGVSSLEILDNVIPFIGGEEEKLESEPQKILGTLPPGGREIQPAGLWLSAQCNRVPVVDGHTACVWVTTEAGVDSDALLRAWREFRPETLALGLPSAPAPPLVVHEGEAHPQPRLHRDLGQGMAVSVGRARRTGPGEFAFVVLSHNTIRGAAGGALLCGELALRTGRLPTLSPHSAS
jgi:aspartate-semialdehyde dehydrogenase